MPQDPVCKMDINKQDAAGEAQYKGDTYYFCSEECKETFDKQPEKYMQQEQQRQKKRAAGR